MLDGTKLIHSKYPDGYYLGPTIIDNDTTDMECYKNEIFGPVFTIIRVNTYEEAMNIANSDKYGNGTVLYTRSVAIARKFTYDAEAGLIGINVPVPIPSPMFSFTGNKASFMGDLNVCGKDAVRFFTQIKTVTSKWKSSFDEISMTMPIMK